MAKVGAAAAVKKKNTTQSAPVQSAPVTPVQTTPVRTGTAMTPQTVAVQPVSAPAAPTISVQANPLPVSEEQHYVNQLKDQLIRQQALEYLQQRRANSPTGNLRLDRAKAIAQRDQARHLNNKVFEDNKKHMAALTKEDALAKRNYTNQYTDFRKDAEKASTKDVLNWLADYKAYRDSGSWDETARTSLATRYQTLYDNAQKYARFGEDGNYLDYKGFQTKANPLDTMTAAYKTLEGPQLLKDVYGTEDYRKNPYDYFPNWQAKSDTLFNQGASLDTYGYDRNDFITPLEAQNYEWLYENKGEKAAEEYRKSLNAKNDASYASWLEEKFNPGYAAEHPVAASVTSVLGTYGAPLAFLENTIATAKGEDINPNSWANALANQRTQLRNEVSKNIDSNAGRFLYNTGMSIGDNLALMPLNALGGAGKMAMLGTLGASAANDRTRELMSQGASSQEAYIRGLASGAIEAITEKVSLDKLLTTSWKGGAANFFKNMGIQGLIEGSEEGASNLLNLAADTITAVVKQEGVGPLEKEIQELEKKGVSRSEATSQVILGHLKDLGMDVAGGALSGAVMGGGYSAFNYNNLVNAGTNIVTNEDGTLKMDVVERLVTRGHNMPADTISHRQADLLQQKINEGKAVTAREAAVLYANNTTAEQAMPYEELLKLRKKEIDPGEWQANKDEAMEHAEEFNKDVHKLYERTVEEAVTNGATGQQAAAEFDRAYTSGFNRLQAPQTRHLSENTVRDIMQAAQSERKTETQPRRMAASRANAERNLDSVNNYAENGSKVYQAAVREALDNGATAEQARVAFNEVYSNVYANKPIPTNTSIPLSAPTIANIREAALKDRFAAENKARADAIPVNTNAGVAISDPVIRHHVEQGRLIETVNLLDELGKRFGVKISLVAKLPQNGQINLRTGEIVVALNTDFGGFIDRDQAVRATLGHELAHRMRQASPKTWDKFTQAVIGTNIDHFNADVNKMIKDTYKGDITRDAAQEEVLADYIGSWFFSGDVDSLRAMAEAIDSLPQRSGFIQHIVDMASWIKSKLTGRPASNAQRIEDEFRKLFKETQAKVRQAEAQRAETQAQPSKEETKAEQNEAPAEKPATKFSMKNHIEQTRDLIAIHNLTEENLLDSVELGGFPMPSIAVIRSNQQHSNYGPISVLFDKSTIDPQASKYNKVYSGDAWTPTFPSIDYKLDRKVVDDIGQRMKGIAGDDLYRALGLSLDDVNMTSKINSYNGDPVAAYSNNGALKYLYLLDKNDPSVKEVPTKSSSLDGSQRLKNDQVIAIYDQLGKDRIEQLYNERLYGDGVAEEIATVLNDQFTQQFADRSDLLEKLMKKPLYSADNINARSAIDAAYRYGAEGISTEPDRAAMLDIGDKNADQAGYEEWLRKQFEGVVENKGIRNEKDMFTPSGNRRSWEALHNEVNLENVVKAMRSQQQKGAGVLGAGSPVAASTREFSSIDEIRESREQLRTIPKEDYDKINEEFVDRFGEIASRFNNRPGTFGSIIDTGSVLCEDIAKSATKETLRRRLQAEEKYGYRYSDDLVDDLWDLIQDIQQMPTGYFEAKPQRAVRFDEWKRVIIPDNSPQKLRDWLDNKGVEYAEYKAGDEADRMRVVNEEADAGDLKFSRRDSDGRTLTAEQAEFFADSKARDADGNLLVLYHGTDGAGFNTFRGTVWMTTSRRDAGSYGGATRTYDPNEQRVDVSAKGGNFTIGSSLRFDTEQDRAEFIKNNPGAENYLTRREMFAAQRAADMEEDYDRYDELVDQEKTDERIRRAYYRYEDQHSETIPLKELIDNKELYTVDDFKRALLSIDSNASFDDEYDYFDTDEAYRDSIAEELEESFINGDEGYDDFPVRVRIPAGKASTVEDLTHIHNRIYEMYANVTRPYTYDAKGRGSEGNGAYYAAVQTALDSDEYDGAIINNIRVGRYQELGTVVVAKDSSQVKLVSNQNPSSDPDIRYSKRSSSNKDAVIRRQQETIDRLRHEMVETHGVEPDPKAIADAAAQFGRDWNSTMPETEIKDAFADIAKEFALYRRLINQGADPNLIRSVEARFNDKCTELANKVVKSAAVLVGDNARAQELKQFVWKHPIQIDPSFKKEFGDISALREAIKGKIKLAKDGMPISRLYESLNEQFSDFPLFQEFEGQTLEPVEMLTDLLDVLNDFDKAYNPYDTADAVDTVAAEIMNTIFDAPVSKPTFADRKAAEVEAAKAETARVREQARNRTPADIKAYYEGKLDDIKEQRDRYLADLVQAYKDRSARAKESEERARLLRIMKRVDRLAKKSSDARRAEIKEITGDFDLVAQRLSNHKVQELTELADWVRRNKDNPDAIITPQISDKLARLDKQHISDLTIGDVRAITEALQEIEHRIRTENRIIGLNERRNTVDIGKQIIQDVRNAPGTGSSALARGADKFLINGLMRPETEFLRLVGFNKNSPLYQYTFGDELSLLTGQKTMQDYQRQAHEQYFRKFLDDKEFMKSITGKNARTVEITGTDEQGKQHTVKVTPDFIMAMYMHSQNVQNLMHIVNYTDEFGREVKAGGMTVPDYKLYKDGKKTEAYNAGTKLTFTRSQFNDQLKGLTPKEMEFIRAAQRYYSEMSQPRINDVSEKLLGYSLAKVDNYFRINTDPDYRGGDMENLRFDGTIEGMGWTKERVNGKNPILLIPLSEQLQKDIVAHSKYVGMAIPIRNFSKIYGVNENTYSQNADGKWELQNAYASSVIKEINKKHPSGADTNYIRDLLADIQNPVSNMSALDKVFAALRSKYAGSVLTLNLGVALKQAASFPTAAAEIGWGPILKTVPQFVKAMGGFAKPMNQKTIDFISKYSPLMRLRTEGMSTQELADMQRLNHKIPGVLNWIQNVDVGTVAALWKASEEYVKQNFKDLKPGSEEFYQKVGDVHTRVITKTQPNYSELQRPGLLRSKSEITKTLMMFKTQPFQNFNILYEAAGSFKAAERAYKANPSEENKAGRDEARKRLAWAISSQVVSNSVFAAMQVIWDIMRRKEDPLDDEDKNVQRLNNFFKNMISSWAGMVPGGSQALEVVEKWVDDALVAMGGEKYFDNKVYGFELDASIEGLNKMVDLITNIPNLGGDIFGLIKGDENKEEYLRDLFKQFKDVSTFFGIPTNNVMNLTKATMEWAMTKGLGYSDEEARYLTDRYLNGVNNSTYSKKHYAELAIAAGEETMQMFRDDPAFDTDSKSAAEYLQEMQAKAEKDKFAEEYGNKEIYVADRDSVTEEAFREFAEKYAQTNDGNGNRSAHDILTALAATDLSEDEKEAIYDLYDYKTPYEKAAGKVEAETTVEEPVASTTETPTRTPLGQARPQGTLTSEVSVGNSQAPTPISKTSTRIRYSKDEMLNVYGANEMYLDTNPLKGDRLDEFNRAYAAVSDNNDSVSQKELAAALNAMGVSLEEGEQIWAAYSQAHADKWGDGWKKTYANYYSGGSSGGSSGGGTSKSSGGGTSKPSGGGRSSGGGSSRSSSASTQPVVGPYPGYSGTTAPAATAPTYTQPVAMPEPVATAPQTPYTGLQRHSEGGNVDLTFRPVLRAVELRRKGWGGVLSDTVRNFVKSYAGNGKALNFTPIVLDEDGKYVRTLSPNELREYAEAVLKGEREDDLKLQVGTAYEGADAMAQAEKAAAEIAQLDKDYTQTA